MQINSMAGARIIPIASLNNIIQSNKTKTPDLIGSGVTSPSVSDIWQKKSTRNFVKDSNLKTRLELLDQIEKLGRGVIPNDELDFFLSYKRQYPLAYQEFSGSFDHAILYENLSVILDEMEADLERLESTSRDSIPFSHQKKFSKGSKVVELNEPFYDFLNTWGNELYEEACEYENLETCDLKKMEELVLKFVVWKNLMDEIWNSENTTSSKITTILGYARRDDITYFLRDFMMTPLALGKSLKIPFFSFKNLSLEHFIQVFALHFLFPIQIFRNTVKIHGMDHSPGSATLHDYFHTEPREIWNKHMQNGSDDSNLELEIEALRLVLLNLKNLNEIDKFIKNLDLDKDKLIMTGILFFLVHEFSDFSDFNDRFMNYSRESMKKYFDIFIREFATVTDPNLPVEKSIPFLEHVHYGDISDHPFFLNEFNQEHLLRGLELMKELIESLPN